MTFSTTTISERPNGSPLTGSERVPMDQGTQTIDASTAQIAGLATKQTVGLGNVDNTSDADKPISTATAAALAAKADAAATTTALAAKADAAATTAALAQKAGINDARLSDARTPLPHAGSHGAGSSDPITPALIGAATAAQGALAATAIQPGNAALTDAREWSAETISQAETEAGTATTRRAFTAQRVRQAVAAWWTATASATGQAVATAASAAAARTALGLGTAATAASSDFLPRTIETVDVAYAATINIDFAADNGKTLAVATLTGPVTFTFSNIAQGRAVSVDLLCDGTQRALTFPAATPFIGPKPSNIAAGKAASLSFECRRSGTTDASVRAAYGVQT